MNARSEPRSTPFTPLQRMNLGKVILVNGGDNQKFVCPALADQRRRNELKEVLAV